MVRLGGLAGFDVDRRQGARHRGDRLHSRPHTQRSAGRHSAFGAAGAVARAAESVGSDFKFVMGARAGTLRGEESVSDLDSLDRLDAHEGTGQAGVETTVPVHVGAESRRQIVGEDFDDSAEGVPGLLRRVDLGDHRRREVRVEAADRIGIQGLDIGRGRQCGQRIGRVFGSADGHGVGHEGDAQFAEELRGDSAQCHAHRGLTCRGALEHGAGFVEAVFLHSDDIGMPGARTGQRGVACQSFEFGGVDGVRVHHGFPFRPFGVADLDRHR